MRAGSLRHALTVQNASTADDATGGYTPTWVSANPAQVWCAVEPAEAGPTENVLGPAERAPITHLVTARYHSGITAKSRLVFGSRYLYVRGIRNVDERNVMMQLSCEERPA